MFNQVYPVFKIPKKIFYIAVAMPEIEVPQFQESQFIEKPKSPIKPKLIEPKKPNIYIFLAMIGLVVFVSASWITAIGPGGGFMLVIAVIVASYIFSREKNGYGVKKAEFDMIMLNYRAELDAYQQHLEQWQKFQTSQHSSMRDYQNRVENYRTQSTERSQKIELARQKFQQIKPLKPIQGSNAPKGRSEEIFHQALSHYLPGEIMVDYRVIKYVEYPYTPDFIYYLKDWNLYVDIEIDEPYTCSGKGKKTTHCTDDQTEINRDIFFEQNDWVVIRFAEEQVLRFPINCCKFIAQTIYLLVGEPIPEKLKKVDDIIAVPRWNTKKAKRMARKKYRHYY